MGVPDKEAGSSARWRPTLASADQHAIADTLTAAVEGRCVNCEAPLASDQRYCVQCGERRGRSRFALARGAGAPAAAAPPRSDPPPRRRSSSGATVVAGIATLVLAMGVGVEIGRVSNRGNATPLASTPKPEVITVNGGASAAQSTTATSSANTPAGRSPAKRSRHGGPGHAAAAASGPRPTQKAVQKASSAASSVLGGGSGQSNATVTSGGSCAAGSAGCQNGHFTGGFFGQ